MVDIGIMNQSDAEKCDERTRKEVSWVTGNLSIGWLV